MKANKIEGGIYAGKKHRVALIKEERKPLGGILRKEKHGAQKTETVASAEVR